MSERTLPAEGRSLSPLRYNRGCDDCVRHELANAEQVVAKRKHRKPERNSIDVSVFRRQDPLGPTMQNSPKTRVSLILRLRDRTDLAAWQQFTEIYQPLVFRLARSKGFQHSDAMDVAQEVLLRVAGAVERWDPDEKKGTFRGWLFRIARNLMIDFLERGKRSPLAAGSSGMVQLIAQHPDPNCENSQVFDLEFRKQVFAWAASKVRSQFQESTWFAFWRTAVDGDSAPDVAGDLNLSLGAVYVARSRVMQRLRAEVQRIIKEDQLDEVQS